ncbi:flagellar biosynthesis protein FlhB [Bacillus sp. 03113]|uniref:flagellar biosynthesis protein FlhB n=1 Tax=Bacillus sp. 03113 TaxID=2578211 RepID=UPI0011439F71|nr:flagellar biosynthesis protein FlhB [Bacillus sp. 03113]
MKWISLDLQYFAGEKTEKATPKKRQDTRKKGQVVKSQDVNTSLILLAVFLFLFFAGPYLQDHVLHLFKHSFENFMLLELSENNVISFFYSVLKDLFFIVGPIMAVAAVAGMITNYMQVGFIFSTETIQFKLDKLNPISGFKRIFLLRAVVELFKSILKIGIVGFITFIVIWKNKEELILLSHKSIGASLSSLASIVIQMGIFSSIALLFLAILDYIYQKFDYEKNIRMSKQDIKDEHKGTEGDPFIKSKIKQKQREIAMRRMMQEIPKADVVITNPTHYAIALKYEDGKHTAPFIVAKGVDFIALKIKKIAKENNVIMVENRPLARALYSQIEIGEVIPEEFFKAVAEILAYVYRTKNKIN